MRVVCPNCGKVLNVPAQAAGKRGKCPGCGQMVPIPPVEEIKDRPRTEAQPAEAGGLSGSTGLRKDQEQELLSAFLALAKPAERKISVALCILIPLFWVIFPLGLMWLFNVSALTGKVICVAAGLVLGPFAAVGIMLPYWRWEDQEKLNELCERYRITRQTLFDLASSDPRLAEDHEALSIIDGSQATALRSRRASEKEWAERAAQERDARLEEEREKEARLEREAREAKRATLPMLRCKECGHTQREGDWEEEMDARARAMGSKGFLNLSALAQCLKCGSTNLHATKG